MSTSATSASQYAMLYSWQALLSTPSAADSTGSSGTVASGGGSCSSAMGDSASFSPQALAQLEADQAAGSGSGSSSSEGSSAQQLTDAQAATVGAILQQNDPSLFAALDQSGSSQLSASDLQSGIANLLQQVQAAGGDGTIDGSSSGAIASSGTGSSGTSPAAELQTIGQAIAQALHGSQGHGHHHGHHGASSATSGTATSTPADSASAATATTDEAIISSTLV